MWLKIIAAVVAVLVLAGLALWFIAGGPAATSARCPPTSAGSVPTTRSWSTASTIRTWPASPVTSAGPQRGGISGGLGFAEDPSDASIACRQIGPIVFKKPLSDGERVFDERRSVIFKSLQVVRFFDAQRKVLVYVSYSDRVFTGSPKNSISSVPLMPWDGTAPRTL